MGESFLEELFYDSVLVDFEILSMIKSCKSQFRIDYKFYDFALEVCNDRFLLIECDGRTYHLSIESQENDAYKNLLARDRGFKLLRFSYDDINLRPQSVADKIEGTIELIRSW